MNNLINIINKLQEIYVNSNLKTKIQLPQIVVVGSQSSGKTSIIEAIVGKDFLPRGSGVVTRRPLILQLKNINNGREWCEFPHIHDKKFEDFSQVFDEIENLTNKVAGYNKGISSEPIILKIFSPNVVDLTLVDLPGLVKVPILDQPDNIESIVRNMVLEFISNPNAIILAVSPANIDLANSDALKIAKEVDPYFQRTIGVITKIDIMDHGTNALDILNNLTFPLKLGYIGVILRSQKDSKDKKTIQEALITEQEYFNNHKLYREINHLVGIKTLTNTLSSILIEHIRTNLPNIKKSLLDEIYLKEKELNLLGLDNGFDKMEVLNSFILLIVFKFCRTYKEILDGSIINDCSNMFIGGSRINFIFQDIFKKEITNIDPFDNLSDDDIRTAIRNTNGLKPTLFIPEAAFEVLIRQQINRFINPSLLCVKRVYDELKSIVSQVEIHELSRYKKLESKIKQIMENVLDICLNPTNQMISNLINIELAYINTSHPDFIGPERSFLNIFDENQNSQNIENGNNINFNLQNNLQEKKFDPQTVISLSQINPEMMRPGVASSRDNMETCIIKNMISSYYSVVKKNISDLVPKTIMYLLVNKSKILAENEMVSQLFKSNDVKVLLQEDPYIADKRKGIKNSLDYLKNSLDVLTSFGNIDF